jgi:Fe(3+) dicitrate transport protein
VDRGVNVPISGNAIEGVPAWIIRQGLDLVAGRWAGTVQSSYTSASLADPLNTRVPTANGARGLVPSYHVVDVNAMWRVSAVMQLSAGLSNVFDEHYFTKRPTIYPGPGVWPSAGRGFRFTVDLTP